MNWFIFTVGVLKLRPPQGRRNAVISGQVNSERSEVLTRFNRDFGGRGGGGGGHWWWISRSSGSILQRFGFKLLVRASRVAKIL